MMQCCMPKSEENVVIHVVIISDIIIRCVILYIESDAKTCLSVLLQDEDVCFLLLI